MSSTGPPYPQGMPPPGTDPNYAYWNSYYQQQMQSWYAYSSPPPPLPPQALNTNILPPPIHAPRPPQHPTPPPSKQTYGTGQYRAPPPLPPPPPCPSSKPGYFTSTSNSRPPGWVCTFCKNHNLAKRTNCNRCQAPKVPPNPTPFGATKEKPVTSQLNTQPPPPPPLPTPSGSMTSQDANSETAAPPSQPNRRPGDWDCSRCSNPNDSHKKKCSKCGKNQSLEDLVYEGKPNNSSSNYPNVKKDRSAQETEGQTIDNSVNRESETPSTSSSSDTSQKTESNPLAEENVDIQLKETPVNTQLDNSEFRMNPRINSGGYDRGRQGFNRGRGYQSDWSRGRGFDGNFSGGRGYPSPNQLDHFGRGRGFVNRGRGRGRGFNPSLPSRPFNKGFEGTSNANFEKLGNPPRGRGRGGFFRGNQGGEKTCRPDKDLQQSVGPSGPQSYHSNHLGNRKQYGQYSFPQTSSASVTEENIPKKMDNTEVCNKEDDLIKQEEKFDKVFSTWEQNFEKWKNDNVNNPDKEYVKLQRMKMEELRSQMLQRRDNIRAQRSKLLEMKRKWSPDNSEQGEQEEPEAKKPVPTESNDMDIENDSEPLTNPVEESGGETKKEEKENSKPGEDKSLSPKANSESSECIPGLGDGKDSEKEQIPSLMDLSTKDFENITKAVQTLTSGKFVQPAEEKSSVAEANSTLNDEKPGTSSIGNDITNPINVNNAGQNRSSGALDWNNKSKTTSNWKSNSFSEMTSSSSSLNSSLFSRRSIDSSNKSSHWNNYDSNPDEYCWKPGETIDYSNSSRGNFRRNRKEMDINYSGRKMHNFNANRNNIGREFIRDNNTRFGHRPDSSQAFHSSAAVEVIDYRHGQQLGSMESVSFKSYANPSVLNTHPQIAGLVSDQDKPLQFKSTSGPTFFMSESSFHESVKDELSGPKEVTIDIDELIQPPGRYTRPPKIMIIFRGLPGSGKTHTVKAIKNAEAELGSETPRILSLDDYFECDGKYEYEKSMEETYRQSLLKSLKKQIDDGYFNFIMVESINNKTEHYKAMADYGLENGFEVYIAEVEAGLSVCAERNIHGRTLKDIEALITDWEDTPIEYKRIDAKSLDEPKSDVEEDEEEEESGRSKEDGRPEEKSEEKSIVKGTEELSQRQSSIKDKSDEEDSQDYSGAFKLSKWEIMDNDPSNARLNDLDGISEKARKKYKQHKSIEDWLDLDGYKQPKDTSGKKTVRWADIEEKIKLDKMRDVGFVVGQTNWSRLMNPSHGESALTQTKIIPNRFQDNQNY